MDLQSSLQEPEMIITLCLVIAILALLRHLREREDAYQREALRYLAWACSDRRTS